MTIPGASLLEAQCPRANTAANAAAAHAAITSRLKPVCLAFGFAPTSASPFSHVGLDCVLRIHELYPKFESRGKPRNLKRARRVCVRIVTWFRKGTHASTPKVNIPVFLISNSTLPLKRQGAHGVWLYIRKSRNQEGTAVSWNRVVDWRRSATTQTPPTCAAQAYSDFPCHFSDTHTQSPGRCCRLL